MFFSYRQILPENYCQVLSNIAICCLVGTELKKRCKKKSNSRFAIKVTERSNHYFYYILDESRFLDICRITELKELN